MHRIREEIEQPINRQKMEDLHFKYIALAKEAEKRENRVLSESYYQHAEYYLHAMNESSNSALTPTSRLSIRTSHPVKKIIEDFNLKRTSDEKPLSKHPNALIGEPGSPQEGVVLPFRGSFLRRKWRGVQHKEI